MPTILFWQPDRYELRADAESYFERLKEVGILYHSPEDAAKQVAAVYEAPDNWWFSETVQNVRNEFVEHFALASENWLQDWCRELIDV